MQGQTHTNVKEITFLELRGIEDVHEVYIKRNPCRTEQNHDPLVNFDFFIGMVLYIRLILNAFSLRPRDEENIHI